MSKEYIEIYLSIDERIQQLYDDKIPNRLSDIQLEKQTMLWMLFILGEEKFARMIKTFFRGLVKNIPILNTVDSKTCKIRYHGNIVDDVDNGRIYLCCHDHNGHNNHI